MKKELTCSSYISIGDAEPVPLESLTHEQIAYCNERMTERLSKSMSEYFTFHIDEYVNFKAEQGTAQ